MGETTIRLPNELLEKAARLVPAVGKRRDLISYARLSKAAVVRLALARGLAELERELLPLEAEGGTDPTLGYPRLSAAFDRWADTKPGGDK